MNDAIYKQLRNKVHPHRDFTAWIRAIQKATILQLRPKEPWTDNETLIQVRRMRKQDLESQFDLPESEVEYEDYLDVVNRSISTCRKLIQRLTGRCE